MELVLGTPGAPREDPQTRGLKMARLSAVAQFAVKLYFRCQMFNEIALPQAGGVMDQDELIVKLLEAVHDEVTAIRLEELDEIRKPAQPQQNFEGVDKRTMENIQVGTFRQRRR